MSRRVLGWPLAVAHLVLLGACGGSPSAPGPPGQTGRIANLQTAADIVTFNQQAISGSSFRRRGVISRWQTPVPVHVLPPLNVADVIAALEHWRERAGIEFQIITEDREPRILVRPGEDGLGAALARGGLDGTYSDNRARSGIIVIGAAAGCATSDCARVYRHETGHALGFFDHADFPGLMSPFASSITVTDREAAMMRELYALPFGATVFSDGTWRVGG